MGKKFRKVFGNLIRLLQPIADDSHRLGVVFNKCPEANFAKIINIVFSDDRAVSDQEVRRGRGFANKFARRA